MEIEKLTFKIGNGIDALARQGYWFEDRQEWAIKVLKCFDGISDKEIQSIIDGNAIIMAKGDFGELVYIEDKEFKVMLKDYLRGFNDIELQDFQKKWLRTEFFKEIKYGNKECIAEALIGVSKEKRIWDLIVEAISKEEDVIYNKDLIKNLNEGKLEFNKQQFSVNGQFHLNGYKDRYFVIESYLRGNFYGRFFTHEYFKDRGFEGMSIDNKKVLIIDMEDLKAYFVDKVLRVQPI